MMAFVAANAAMIPARELDVFYKIYFETRSKRAAADALGVTVNTLNTLLRRLRQRLRSA